MVESSIVTYEGRLIDYQVGTLSDVEFDFLKIWKYSKRFKEFDPLYLHFFHVHPHEVLAESLVDINCMKGLAQAFGESSPFHIVTFKNDDIKNLDCDVLTLFYNIKTDNYGRIFDYKFIYPNSNFLILKLLAYGVFPLVNTPISDYNLKEEIEEGDTEIL